MLIFLFKTIIVMAGIYLLFVFLPSLPISINSTQTQRENLFSVTAQGEAVATPDLAKITLGVEKKAGTAKATQQQANKVVADLGKKLSELGVKDKDIKTTRYNLYPDYVYQDGERKLNGFKASISLQVTSRDFDKLSQVLEVASSVGVNTIGNLSLEVEDPEELKARARKEAIQKAKEKAKVIAKESGLKRGRLIDVTVNDQSNRRLYNAPELTESSSEASAPSIEPGESSVTVSVTLSYLVD